MASNVRPVVLCILDGWGNRADTAGNAIALADTPNWDCLLRSSPHSALDASAGEVGLPEGQMGNSEVGHMNIGAGRVVIQDLPRIDAAVADGSLADKPQLNALIETLRGTGGACHILGLVSPGGVHAHQNHIIALIKTLDAAGIAVRVHAVLDGRDTPPKSGRDYVAQLAEAITECKQARIATVTGRFYAMDRDKRWDRVARAYQCLADANAPAVPDADSAIANGYAHDVTDEFLEPVIVDGYGGMQDGDALFMANFRADRAREIMSALVDPDFTAFDRPRRVAFSTCLGMVEYSEDLNRYVDALFPAIDIADTLGDVVSKTGLKQLRTAETEKYAHVTFFLNGGREKPYAGEERHLVPSPTVATYDLQPEMSAPAVADAVIAAVTSREISLIVVNFANTDMVGHTGILDAAIKAVETVDTCLGRISDAVESVEGTMIVTADHGNAEQMYAADGQSPHTAHTINKVPFVLVGRSKTIGLRDGRLADIAPTILDLMGLPKPAAMTGRSLIGDSLTEPAAGLAAQA